MDSDLIFLFPNTPLEKATTLAQARALWAQGQLPGETPCALSRESLPTTIAVLFAELPAGPLPSVAVGPTVSQPTPPPTAAGPIVVGQSQGKGPSLAAPKLSVAGPSVQNVGLSASRTDPMRPEDIDFLISRKIVDARFVGTLTRKQARKLISGYHLKRFCKRIIWGVVLLAVIGGGAYAVKKYAPDLWSSGAAAVESIAEKSAEAADVVIEHVGATTDTVSNFVGINTSSDSWNLSTFGDRIGVVYDSARGPSPMNSYAGCGFVAQYNGRVYFFTPQTVAGQPKRPQVALLNGMTFSLEALPVFGFGQWDVAAFDLGSSHEWLARLQNSGFPTSELPLLSVSPRASSRAMPSFYIVGKGFHDSMFLKKKISLRRGKNAIDIELPINEHYIGMLVMDPSDGFVEGMVARSYDTTLPEYVRFVDFSVLPPATPLDFKTMAQEGAQYWRMVDRTQTLADIGRKGIESNVQVSDATFNNLLRSTRDKLAFAQQRKNYAQQRKETATVLHNFNAQVSNLAVTDLTFSLPFFQYQAGVHKKAREDSLKRLSDTLSGIDF